MENNLEFLGKLKMDKIIPCSYSSIQHLPGSKMIDNEDKLIGQHEVEMMTMKLLNPHDIVIVTEKLDGMNAAVYRSGNKLYPLVRKGYDARNNFIPWIQAFAYFVNDFHDKFMQLLYDNERVCGEWLIKTHTVRYDFKGMPFVAFDMIKGNSRERFFTMKERCEECKIPVVPLIHAGVPISTSVAVDILGKGFYGADDGCPEGVVYRYETETHGWYCSAKYVFNPKVGKNEEFKADDLHVFNNVQSRYRKYRWGIIRENSDDQGEKPFGDLPQALTMISIAGGQSRSTAMEQMAEMRAYAMNVYNEKEDNKMNNENNSNNLSIGNDPSQDIKKIPKNSIYGAMGVDNSNIVSEEIKGKIMNAINKNNDKIDPSSSENPYIHEDTGKNISDYPEKEIILADLFRLGDGKINYIIMEDQDTGCDELEEVEIYNGRQEYLEYTSEGYCSSLCARKVLWFDIVSGPSIMVKLESEANIKAKAEE